MNKHQSYDLKQMQSLPLEAKIKMTQKRIRQWFDHYDGEVYVSFSGGKDSTVLKHLVDNTVGVYDVPAVFVNTGLEYPEIQKFVRDMKNGKFDGFNSNIEIIRPEMRFDEVIKTYGYPVGSKQISRKIHDAKKGVNWALKFVDGTAVDKEGRPSRYCIPKRWLPLLDADFEVSNKCCDVMKKKPVKQYSKQTGRKPYIGTMASESSLRKTAWLKNGCNAFDSKDPKSTPMAFWTEQDVLEYIVKFNLPYAKVYGEIKQDSKGKYYTTGVSRTGCMFCMFGCHLEKSPNRFQRMKQTHPKQYDYCMNNLGLKKVLEYIGVDYE